MRLRTLNQQCTVHIMIIYRKMERYVCLHTKTLESKANQLEIVLDCIENHSDQPFTSSNNLAAGGGGMGTGVVCSHAAPSSQAAGDVAAPAALAICKS